MVIGPYKLLEQIGEGGMGVVYLAEQTQPVRRKVALKIIKPGMDTRQVIARFEAERQALALMDHPNIAKVLDAGATDTGRPYFVMELVKGVPITTYCDTVHLTPRERLELFIPVCQAIQHAHQKGIIHRDIKPSNVLVTMVDGKPVPKVIDFGVAKAIDQRLTERTMFTQHGAIVGTFEYMSPEQAELLGPGHRHAQRHLRAGRAALRAAHRLDAAGEGEGPPGGVFRDPPPDQGGGAAEALDAAERFGRPPGLAGGAAADRAGPAGEAGPRRARLDRDEGAGEGPHPAVRDGQRLRPRHRALPRRRPGRGRARRRLGYRLGKFARRNKSLLTTIVLLLLASFTGTGVSIWYALEARTAKRVANERLGVVQHAEQIAQRNLDRSIDAIDQMLVRIGSERLKDIPQMTPVRREILEDAKKRIEAMLGEDPTDPRLRYQLAKTQLLLGYVYEDLGQIVKARQNDREVVSAAERLLAEDPENREYQHLLAQALSHIAWSLGDGRGGESSTCMQRSLAIRKSLFERFPEDVQVRNELMNGYNAVASLMSFVNLREAEELLREAIRLAADSSGADRVAIKQLGDAFRFRGQILTQQRRFDEAAPAFESSLADYHGCLAARGPLPDNVNAAEIRGNQAVTCNEFANMLAAAAQPEKSEKLRLESIDKCKRLMADFPTQPGIRKFSVRPRGVSTPTTVPAAGSRKRPS